MATSRRLRGLVVRLTADGDDRLAKEQTGRPMTGMTQPR